MQLQWMQLIKLVYLTESSSHHFGSATFGFCLVAARPLRSVLLETAPLIQFGRELRDFILPTMQIAGSLKNVEIARVLGNHRLTYFCMHVRRAHIIGLSLVRLFILLLRSCFW